MNRSKGKYAAQRLMKEIGLDNVQSISLELLLAGRNAILKEKPLSNSDGRIVFFGDNKSLITVNSDIQYEGRKRFTIAHELGHHEMHRGQLVMHNDTRKTLDYFKKGSQETEANEFASELLMPEKLFKKLTKGRLFCPDLLRELADYFQTSITSVAYKYFYLGEHPICLFYTRDNQVEYWKRHPEFGHYIEDYTRLSPPGTSVVAEFFDSGTIYRREDSIQKIDKSTWFVMNSGENDRDYTFFEYCIITKKFNTVLSIVWEE